MSSTMRQLASLSASGGADGVASAVDEKVDDEGEPSVFRSLTFGPVVADIPLAFVEAADWPKAAGRSDGYNGGACPTPEIETLTTASANGRRLGAATQVLKFL